MTKPTKQVVTIRTPAHTWEVAAEVYADWLAVHPTLYGTPEKPARGKQGWRNYTVTLLANGQHIGKFRYQRTAKAYAAEVAETFKDYQGLCDSLDSHKAATALWQRYIEQEGD